MARTACDFVKGAKAAWYCDHCDTKYSEQCIPDGTNAMWGRAGPVCILCHSPLIPADDPRLQLPFWQVLPYLFIYPLHINALLVMLVGVGGIFALGNGLLAISYALIFSIILVKYYVSLLADRAQGRRWPPGLITLAKPDPHWLFLQMVVIYALFAAAIVAAAILADVRVALGVGALVAAALPASIMILALEKNCLRAANPLDIINLIGAMGFGPYIALWILTAVIGLGPVALEHWLIPALDTSYHFAVAVGAGIYFSMVIHALMGYALYQYRDAIGIVDMASEAKSLDEPAFQRARSLGAVIVLEKTGDYVRAREQMRSLLDICRDDLDLHRHYQRLLLNTQDEQAIARHTDYLAGLLLEAGRQGEAVALLRQTSERQSDYRIASAAVAAAAAEALGKAKEYRLLVKLLANLHKRVAPDQSVATAYTLLAKALAGPLGEPEKARAVAAYTLKHYPQAPQAKSLKRLVRV